MAKDDYWQIGIQTDYPRKTRWSKPAPRAKAQKALDQLLPETIFWPSAGPAARRIVTRPVTKDGRVKRKGSR